MRSCKNKYDLKTKLYSLVMLLALAWLTVSLPYVYADQQAQKAAMQKQCTALADDGSNPLTNTTEEKTETGVNTLSEFLHEIHHTEHLSCLIEKSYNFHTSDLYLAFHPEMICPPPDAIAS